MGNLCKKLNIIICCIIYKKNIKYRIVYIEKMNTIDKFENDNLVICQASIIDLVFAILCIVEVMTDKADSNLFCRTMIDQLKFHFLTLSKFYIFLTLYASEEFIKFFSKCPFRYKNQVWDNLLLKDVKIHTIVHVLVARLELGVIDLFYKPESTQSNPFDVVYHGCTSKGDETTDKLFDFSNNILQFWQKIDETFSASFYIATKIAINADKTGAHFCDGEDKKIDVMLINQMNRIDKMKKTKLKKHSMCHINQHNVHMCDEKITCHQSPSDILYVFDQNTEKPLLRRKQLIRDWQKVKTVSSPLEAIDDINVDDADVEDTYESDIFDVDNKHNDIIT